MIYSDVSCVVENTINKFINLNINQMLKIDYFALITVTNYGKIIIDGNINYKAIDSSIIIEFLEKREKFFFDLDCGIILINNNKAQPFNIIIAPIRAQYNYKVFGISCVFNESYTKKDLSIVEFIFKTSYENVLLDNERIKEQNYLNNIFESAKSFIIGFDLEEIITTANKVAFDIFGGKNRKLIGYKHSIFLAKNDSYKLSKSIQHVINNKIMYLSEKKIFLNTTQGEIFVNLTISRINDNKGEAVGVVIFGSDITKQMIYEREIEQLNQYAVLGELAAGVAHEIRNPLMSIRGCARVLEKKLVNCIDCKSFIEPIIEEVDRINEKLMQMLSYSFINEDHMYSKVDINEVLDKCVNILNFHKNSKCINIERKLQKDLSLISGNKVQMHQIFLNILFNAVDAIESSGTIIVKSENLISENRVLVTIFDNGVGISYDKINQIFSPLFTTKSEGMGVGLSIVKRVVERNNGEIAVSSKKNEGTEFKVYLPY